jgi:hypothetical protein
MIHRHGNNGLAKRDNTTAKVLKQKVSEGSSMYNGCRMVSGNCRYHIG